MHLFIKPLKWVWQQNKFQCVSNYIVTRKINAVWCHRYGFLWDTFYGPQSVSCVISIWSMDWYKYRSDSNHKFVPCIKKKPPMWLRHKKLWYKNSKKMVFEWTTWPFRAEREKKPQNNSHVVEKANSKRCDKSPSLYRHLY